MLGGTWPPIWDPRVFGKVLEAESTEAPFHPSFRHRKQNNFSRKIKTEKKTLRLKTRPPSKLVPCDLWLSGGGLQQGPMSRGAGVWGQSQQLPQGRAGARAPHPGLSPGSHWCRCPLPSASPWHSCGGSPAWLPGPVRGGTESPSGSLPPHLPPLPACRRDPVQRQSGPTPLLYFIPSTLLTAARNVPAHAEPTAGQVADILDPVQKRIPKCTGVAVAHESLSQRKCLCPGPGPPQASAVR